MSRRRFFKTVIFIALSTTIAFLFFSLSPPLSAPEHTTFASLTAYAQEPDYDQINEIARQLNCPTCAGINLADCRTQTCAQWKDQISDLLQEGYDEQGVLDYFVVQYGTQVLQEPPKRGFTLGLWLVPVVALLAGAGWLLYTMRSWTRRKAELVTATLPSTRATNGPSPKTIAAHDDYLSQVEKDL
jgi:cytochrome c-type biogenesis protein CcmH